MAPRTPSIPCSSSSRKNETGSFISVVAALTAFAGGWGVPHVMGSLVYSSVDRAQAGDGIAAGQPQGAGQPQQPGAAGGPAGPK